MSKSVTHQTEGEGTFRVEEVEEIPERILFRGPGASVKWLWLKQMVVNLQGRDNVLKIECPNRVAMVRAQSAIQNCTKAKRHPRLPEGYKIKTRSEPAPGTRNGVYHLYVEVTKKE